MGSGLHYEMYEMSYEVIDKKESKEERLELSLFLPLDGPFFYFQNIKKI